MTEVQKTEVMTEVMIEVRKSSHYFGNTMLSDA